MGLFSGFSTNRKLNEVLTELDDLKRRFRQVEQEWDATQSRVSKVLRRLAREAQAEEEQTVEIDENGEPSLPLTAMRPSPDRMARIQQQLRQKREAERK